MKFAAKKTHSEFLVRKLRYSQSRDRAGIREILFREQRGYCAYSEVYLYEADGKDIEHFLSQAEHPNLQDDYTNLYLVDKLVHSHKKKKLDKNIDILHPKDVVNQIQYNPTTYICEALDNDAATNNLIEYLQLNNESLVRRREHEVGRIALLRNFLSSDELVEYMQNIEDKHSFLSQLESSFGIELFHSIFGQNNTDDTSIS